MVSLAEHNSCHILSLSYDVGNCSNCRCTVWMRNLVLSDGLLMGHAQDCGIIAHAQNVIHVPV